jgi:hypothetical protein
MQEKKAKERKKAPKGLDTERIGRGVKEAMEEAAEFFAPAIRHLLLAEKELLLAARSVLDKAIEKADEMAARQEKKGERAKKVKIKVE